MPLGFGKKPQPPKPLEEMTPEELDSWKQQNKRAVIILAIGCILSLFVIGQGVIGVVKANRERGALFALREAPQAVLSASTGYAGGAAGEGLGSFDPAEMDSDPNAPLFGSKVKLSREANAVLRPAGYLWLPDADKPCPPPLGQVIFLEAADPGVLTETEKAAALRCGDTYYFLALEGKFLASTVYAVGDAGFFTAALDRLAALH